MGLIYNGLGGNEPPGATTGTNKKAYYTYLLLAGHLAGTRGAEKLADGVYRFVHPEGPLFIVWKEGAAGDSVVLDALDGATVTVKDLVPDSSGALNTESVEVAGGRPRSPWTRCRGWWTRADGAPCPTLAFSLK